MNGVLSPTVCFQEMGKILRWAGESGGNLLYFVMGPGKTAEQPAETQSA